jgi:hypothetical protein
MAQIYLRYYLLKGKWCTLVLVKYNVGLIFHVKIDDFYLRVAKDKGKWAGVKAKVRHSSTKTVFAAFVMLPSATAANPKINSQK